MVSTDEGFRVSSTKSEHVAPLNAWLLSHGTIGLEPRQVEFRSSTACADTLGCFAARDFQAGEVIFRIPKKIIFSYKDVLDSQLSLDIIASTHDNEIRPQITQEFLIWIEMCRQRCDDCSILHHYLNSLGDEPPGVSQWPCELKDALVGTSLYGCGGFRDLSQSKISIMMAARILEVYE